MIDLFNKYACWKVLRHFALHPSSEMYVKEIAKKLDLSTGMSSEILRKLESSGILEVRKLGQAHYYSLKESYMTTELKRFVGLFHIYDSGLVNRLLDEMPEIHSIALYGSYAKGDFNEHSDIDLLLITHQKADFDLGELEDKLDIEINLQAFSIGQWLKLKRSSDPFYNELMNHHVLLYGVELP